MVISILIKLFLYAFIKRISSDFVNRTNKGRGKCETKAFNKQGFI